MPHSKWSISTTGNFLHNNRLLKHRVLNIIHVEDHKLFAHGLRDLMLPFFPLMSMNNIQDGNQAIRFIEEQINEKIKIDLIITDINHPGLKGDKLVERLRQFEKRHRLKAIPVIVISFVTEDQLPHLLGPGQQMLCRYLSKGAEVEEIIEAMEDIFYGH